MRGTSPRRKWLLRGGALAVAGALSSVPLSEGQFFAPVSTPVRPVETAVTTPDAAVVPVEEADKKAEEIPSVSAETVTIEAVETDPSKPDPEMMPSAKAAPVVMMPAPAPVEVSAVTKPEVPALSDQRDPACRRQSGKGSQRKLMIRRIPEVRRVFP